MTNPFGSRDGAEPATGERPLRGRTVLIITLTAFAVIVTANMALVVAATGSFPGTVVKNSYIASQYFDDRHADLAAHGWTLEAGYADGYLSLSVSDADGDPVDGLAVAATLGRPALAATDRTVAMLPDRYGYAARTDLAPGRWQAVIEIVPEEGAPVTLRQAFTVKE
ncbi:MAG: FixH family protein [Pseudomonadota bacterium]